MRDCPTGKKIKAYLDGAAFPFNEDDEEVEQGTSLEEEINGRESESIDDNIMPRNHEEQAEHDIHCLNRNQLTANDLRTKPWFQQSEYLEAFILQVVRNSDPRHRKKMPPTQNTLKKAVDLWLNEENKEKRNFFFLKLDGLQQAMVRKYGVQWKSRRFGADPPKITEKDILEHLGLDSSGGNNDDETSKTLLLTALLKQSFYPSLKGEAKEAASIGHKMEVPFCRNLERNDPNFKAAFQVGLVEKINEPWVKCSADFITITDDDGLKLEITEMKARTSVTTAGIEQERVDRINSQYDRTIEATSPFFRNHVAYRAEALQLLHHAFTFDCEFARHVTGDSHGRIISSVRVSEKPMESAC